MNNSDQKQVYCVPKVNLKTTIETALTTDTTKSITNKIMHYKNKKSGMFTQAGFQL